MTHEKRHNLITPIAKDLFGAITLKELVGSRYLWDDFGFPWESLGTQGTFAVWYSAEREHAGIGTFLAFFVKPGTNLSK